MKVCSSTATSSLFSRLGLLARRKLAFARRRRSSACQPAAHLGQIFCGGARPRTGAGTAALRRRHPDVGDVLPAALAAPPDVPSSAPPGARLRVTTASLSLKPPAGERSCSTSAAAGAVVGARQNAFHRHRSRFVAAAASGSAPLRNATTRRRAMMSTEQSLAKEELGTVARQLRQEIVAAVQSRQGTVIIALSASPCGGRGACRRRRATSLHRPRMRPSASALLAHLTSPIRQDARVLRQIAEPQQKRRLQVLLDRRRRRAARRSRRWLSSGHQLPRDGDCLGQSRQQQVRHYEVERA